MRTAARAALALLLAACATTQPRDEDPPANRADVAAALHRQLDLVLDRYAALEGNPDPLAVRERSDLARLAEAIAVRIVRVDPEADVEELIGKLEGAR